MAARRQFRGVCQLCGETFTKSGMSNHLRSCQERPSAGASGDSRTATRLLHLAIQDRYNRAYWLHLELPEFATLGMLDHYLRDIWLECCGHLSEFMIHDQPYVSFDEDAELGYDFGPPAKSMFETTLSSVLGDGATFRHSYDFGSTTELEGRVVDEREGWLTADAPVRLLARNLTAGHPPATSAVSGLPGFARTASGRARGSICQACAEDHDCDWGSYEEMIAGRQLTSHRRLRLYRRPAHLTLLCQALCRSCKEEDIPCFPAVTFRQQTTDIESAG